MNATVDIRDVLLATQGQREALANDNAMLQARNADLERQLKAKEEELSQIKKPVGQ